MNSPTVPPVRSPKLSEETTLFTFTAARCSMMALALPSRSEETVNSASLMTVPSVRVLAEPAGPDGVISKSRVAMRSAPTCKVAVAGS